MQAHNKATEWFDALYKKHENNHENIPWASKDVNKHLKSYLDAREEHKGRALVIGCGLGDDAYALAKAGYDVVAIDVSQTALNLAKKRFSGVTIAFEKQDIFDMPSKYDADFDFVFEALTIQSLPREFRGKIIQAIVKSVALQGKLLVVAHKQNRVFDGPPWPLKDEDMTLFKEEGMKEVEFDIIQESSKISDIKFRVLYEK